MKMNYEFLMFIPENAPDDLVNLVCVLKGDIKKGLGDVFIKFCEDRDGILNMLRNDMDGVFLDGDVFEYPYDKEQDVTYIEYPLKVKNEDLFNFIKKLNNKQTIFNNKIALENIMAKQAPYKLWTIEALKNECTQRKFDPASYKDVADKNVLVKALQLDDAKSTQKQAVTTEKSVVEEKKAPAVTKKTPPVPPAKKKTVEKPNPAEKAMEETKKIVDAEKPKKSAPDVSGVINLNQKLRDAGLWKTGCQFLSTDEKNKLIAAKTDKERKAIYDALEKKRTSINATLSEKMKGKTVAKKAQTVEAEAEVEETVEAVTTEKSVVEEKKAPVVTKKVPPVPPTKKVPPVPGGKKIVNKK